MTEQNGVKKTIFITGATSGIGLSLAKHLAPTHNLILSGRMDMAKAKDILLPCEQYIQADMSKPESAVTQITQKLEDIALDHAVLCHGMGFYKQPLDENVDDIRTTLDVNLLNPILVSKALFPALDRAKGRLTLIGSVAHKGAGNMPSYAASKAGIHGFARALEMEWQDRVSVQVIHPGPTLTPMLAKAGYSVGAEKHLFLSPSQMATEIARLIKTGKTPATIFLGAKIKSLFWPFGSSKKAS